MGKITHLIPDYEYVLYQFNGKQCSHVNVLRAKKFNRALEQISRILNWVPCFRIIVRIDYYN